MSDLSLKQKKTVSPNKLDTVCKDCIFAEYENQTQTSCKLDKINLYKKHGINILECFDIESDGKEIEFYVLDKYKCLYKRTKLWNKYEDYINGTISQKDIEQELELSYQAIINVTTDEDYIYTIDIGKIEDTIKSLVEQAIPPKFFSIVLPKPLFDPNYMWQIHDMLNQYTRAWKTHQITNPSYDKEDSIDIALKSHHLPYYLTIDAGDMIDNTQIFRKINNKILNECFRFSIIKINQCNFVVYSVHEIMNGNYVFKLEDKIKNIWKNNTGIYDVSEIYD